MLIHEFPGIEWQIFDEMTFDECVTLFNNANIIIASHGAGLANMIFSPENTKIIEFMPITFPNLCFKHMATMLDFDYYCFPVQDSGPEHGYQMNVDVKFLLNEIKKNNII